MNLTILRTLEIRPREKFPNFRSNPLRCRWRTTEANVFQFQALRRILDYSRCTKRGCRRKVHCVHHSTFMNMWMCGKWYMYMFKILHSFTTILPEQYALGSLLQMLQVLGGVWTDKAWRQVWGDLWNRSGELGKVPGKVVGKAREGFARTVSEFGFQHALFVGDMTWVCLFLHLTLGLGFSLWVANPPSHFKMNLKAVLLAVGWIS